MSLDERPEDELSVAASTVPAVSDGEARDTEVRKGVSDETELRIWTKSAGRCALCSSYLLDNRTQGHLHTTKVGQVAHVIGATATPKSPRGKSPLSTDDRAQEGNLLLLCYGCHRMVDDLANVHYWTEERLMARKEEHEERVLRATDFATLTQAVVITTEGEIRGSLVQIPPRQVMHAMIEAGLITHVDGGQRNEHLIRLQGNANKHYYWDSGRDQIDRIVKRALTAANRGEVDRLALFAMLPIPLLVYLGACIGSTLGVTVFDRHRDDVGSDSWTWRKPDRESTVFEIVEGEEDSEAREVVAQVAISGSATAGALPDVIAGLPRIELRPSHGDARVGLVESEADVTAAVRAWTDLLAKIETLYPKINTLHVIAAVPASVAVNMGRQRMRGAHPDLVIYELNDKEYIPTPPITDPEDD